MGAGRQLISESGKEVHHSYEDFKSNQPMCYPGKPVKYVLLDTTWQGGGRNRCASKDVGLCCFCRTKRSKA